MLIGFCQLLLVQTFTLRFHVHTIGSDMEMVPSSTEVYLYRVSGIFKMASENITLQEHDFKSIRDHARLQAEPCAICEEHNLNKYKHIKSLWILIKGVPNHMKQISHCAEHKVIQTGQNLLKQVKNGSEY